MAKFRFVPSASSAEVAAWYERMVDLSGGLDLLVYVDRHKDPQKGSQTSFESRVFGSEHRDYLTVRNHCRRERIIPLSSSVSDRFKNRVITLPVIIENVGLVSPSK